MMKGDQQVIINFNRLLVSELNIANQYFLHSKVFKHWGLTRLGDIEYQEFLDEMKHADCYIKRILFLSGSLGDIKYSHDSYKIGKDVEALLRFDLALENNTVNDLREYIVYTDTVHDFVSRDIMIDILSDEEKHIDFLETEISLMTRLGMHNYLQSQLR